MVIFNSYVKLPEVKWVFIVLGIQSHCTILYPSLRTSQDYIMDDKKARGGQLRTGLRGDAEAHRAEARHEASGYPNGDGHWAADFQMVYLWFIYGFIGV